MNEEFKAALDNYVAHVQKVNDDNIKAVWSGKDGWYEHGDDIVTSSGKKYVRIMKSRRNTDGNSVHSFVDTELGNIWKPASWKAPAKNFARGNIFDAESIKGIGPYSAS